MGMWIQTAAECCFKHPLSFHFIKSQKCNLPEAKYQARDQEVIEKRKPVNLTPAMVGSTVKYL